MGHSPLKHSNTALLAPRMIVNNGKVKPTEHRRDLTVYINNILFNPPTPLFSPELLLCGSTQNTLSWGELLGPR